YSELSISDILIVPYVTHFPFFFNATAPTEIYTLSLHDALPIAHFQRVERRGLVDVNRGLVQPPHRLGELRPLLVGQAPGAQLVRDRKSTRLNSSHLVISYAVFCLKKKKKTRSVS